MNINWYPGHMAKTRRLMTDDMKKVDIVCEIIDARIPKSSRNPDLDKVIGTKKRMIILNRADQAQNDETEKWVEYFKKSGYFTLVTDSQSGKGIDKFSTEINKAMADEIARNIAKGAVGKSIRVMVVGIPNVGKSSFINRILGKKSAIAANRPGVTRIKQWFSLPDGVDLMDTPGMLPPKIENDTTGVMLAFTGTIKDDIIDIEELSLELIKVLGNVSKSALVKRFGFTENAEDTPYELLEKMARKRGFLLARNEVDTERMAKVLLDEFRNGKLGNITLEKCN